MSIAKNLFHFKVNLKPNQRQMNIRGFLPRTVIITELNSIIKRFRLNQTEVLVH